MCGAVIGVLPEIALWPALEASYAAAGFGIVRASIAPPVAGDAA